MLRFTVAIGFAAVAAVAAGTVAAQAPEPPVVPQLDDTFLENVDIERARLRLTQAQQQLEEAARNVATVVPTQLEPLLYRLNSTWPRAQLGMGLTDAEQGALVTSVTPGSAAADAGVKVGDIIRSVDGVELVAEGESPTSRLMGQLETREAGDDVALSVNRMGEVLNLDATVGTNGFVRFGNGNSWIVSSGAAAVRGGGTPVVVAGDSGATAVTPNLLVRSFGFASQPWGDMELVSVTEELGRYFATDEGLLVVRGPSDDAIGIADGDVILAIGGRTPSSPEHAIRILASFEPGETIELSLMRDRRSETVEYLVPEAAPGALGRHYILESGR